MDPRRLNRLLIGPPFLFFIAHNATRHEYMELKGACRVLCAPDLSRTTQRDTSIWNSKVRVACCALRTYRAQQL
jgi:hypothetical protein